MNNVNFILTPIDKLIDDAITSTAGLHNKLYAYPVVEYIMHSLFLKISGMLEQKMYSIIFEMSSNHIDLRYKALNGYYKGVSSLNDKNKILKELIEQITLYANYDMVNKLEYIDISYWQDSINKINEKFYLSLFMDCNIRQFKECHDILTSLDITKKTLHKDTKLKNNLFIIYEKYLCPTRNRLAHNEYVQYNNIPTIKDIARDSYKYNNYFLFFTIFHYIDIVFMNSFKQYIECIDNNGI